MPTCREVPGDGVLNMSWLKNVLCISYITARRDVAGL